MSRIENKSLRLAQIEALLMDHPEGLTQAQIARALDVHRSTIHRNLVDLTAPTFEENGRIMIDREAYLVNLRLNLHEALAIHLAGRLMATRLDRRNPHAAAAFRKLGIALEKLAPQISQFVRCSANSFDNETKRQDPHYLQVLEMLTIAWSKSQKVQLWYHSAERGLVKEYIFCPYFIEAGAVGQAIYSIGRIEPTNEMRTFKIERVERIELTNQAYSIPMEFNPAHLFSQAWGIWFTDQPPVDVVLKFSPNVASRVCETRWHPGEQTSMQPDGFLIWCASIAEPREMMPWVRGWGADVEVIEPKEMRESIISEIAKLRTIYGIYKNHPEE
jgi:predicted DNA-binding transcriptional regulator YafY